MIKRLLAVMLLAALTIPTFVPSDVSASDEDSVRIYIDGRLLWLNFNEAPMLVDNTTLVPFRPVFEALGLAVDWDEKTKR